MHYLSSLVLVPGGQTETKFTEETRRHQEMLKALMLRCGPSAARILSKPPCPAYFGHDKVSAGDRYLVPGARTLFVSSGFGHIVIGIRNRSDNPQVRMALLEWRTLPVIFRNLLTTKRPQLAISVAALIGLIS
jgi:hypothetical protein